MKKLLELQFVESKKIKSGFSFFYYEKFNFNPREIFCEIPFFSVIYFLFIKFFIQQILFFSQVL